MLIISQEDWLDLMSVNLQANFTSFPVHQSVAPYVQIYSREASQETATHFVLWGIPHSWGWALPPEMLPPVPATALPLEDCISKSDWLPQSFSYWSWQEIVER